MAKQTVNLGTIADDGTGDTLRVGGDKINDNFDELYGMIDTDGTLAANSDAKIPTQKAVKTAIAAAVVAVRSQGLDRLLSQPELSRRTEGRPLSRLGRWQDRRGFGQSRHGWAMFTSPLPTMRAAPRRLWVQAGRSLKATSPLRRSTRLATR
jgi:hypothetical protein